MRQSLPQSSHIIFYYHPDYLGHVEYVTDGAGVPQQYFHYSPWGESLIAQTRTPNPTGFTTTYRFNAKELDPESGLFYYGARYYDPMTSVWLSVDPMAHKAPGWTPYRFSFNNPIKFIDPNGLFESTHTDEDGNVIAVYDDGDNGVYRHKGKGKEAEKLVRLKYNKNNTSAGGERMGESLHSLSFADQNLYNKMGKVKRANLKIDFGSTELTEKVQEIIDAKHSLIKYALKAKENGEWDIKRHVLNGSLLFGKYASPRDAGNFAAGVVAQMSGLEPIAQFGYGAYNLTGNSILLTGIVTYVVGLTTLYNPFLGLSAGYLIGKYGEDKLTQRSIDLGKEFIKRK